ncbi:glycosyltransferase, partial [bacterium]
MEGLRVGIDIRALQSAGGSAERGIGRYVTDLVVGLRDHAPEITPVLFGLAERPVPKALVGSEVVPVAGPIFAELPRPWFGGIPKLRSSSALWGRRHRAARTELAAGLTRAVAGARLNVLHFPSAVDVGSYPEVESDVPQVRTFLDAIPYRLRETYFDRWPAFMQDYYREQLDGLRKARIVVAISRASADDARDLAHVPEERLRVVYPAVDDRYRVHGSEPPPFDLGSERYVLFCSVPDAHKNPGVAIEAFARAELDRSIRLVFVSPLDRAESNEMIGMADRLGVGDRFLITGHIPEERMPALFAGALALLSPSQMEGFGLPAAQAMA